MLNILFDVHAKTNHLVQWIQCREQRCNHIQYLHLHIIRIAFFWIMEDDLNIFLKMEESTLKI